MYQNSEISPASLQSEPRYRTMRNFKLRPGHLARTAFLIATGLVLNCAASGQQKTALRTSGPISSSSGSTNATPIVTPEYRIGAGDVLAIIVYKEPDASAESVVVRSDGVITVPIIKEVSAAGLLPRELEAILTQKYARFIREPDVTVAVREINSQKAFVVGAVRKEGPLSLSTPLTVLQAISAAGGLTDYARKDKITILRVQDGKQVRIPFRYSAVVNGSDPNLNLFLRPGDTIIVPQ
jgi:polysaccharide biosynthesis/export protein